MMLVQTRRESYLACEEFFGSCMNKEENQNFVIQRNIEKWRIRRRRGRNFFSSMILIVLYYSLKERGIINDKSNFYYFFCLN